MKTEKAEFLNAFIDSAISTYNEYNSRSKNSKPLREEEKQKYGSEAFKTHFNNFTEELKENIRTYKDISVIRDYVQAYFSMLMNTNLFSSEENKWIIEIGYEVEFLIKLKKDIQLYITEIKACTIANVNNICSGTALWEYYQTEMEAINPQAQKTTEEPEYQPEKRFDFNELKAECAGLKSAVEKLKLINDRLFDFKQWQLQHDNYIENIDLGNFYELTYKYYSKFEKLCAIEIQRINKISEVERHTIITSPKEPEPILFPYKWQATDTDFLELFAAIYQNESIVRTDGKPLTRKELLEYFQSILGLQIKDAEGKLNRAGNRNENTAFLDTLAQQFRNYVATKEEKSNSRK